MKTNVINRFLRKFLFTGILVFCVTVSVTGQVSYERMYNGLKNAVNKGTAPSSQIQPALNSIEAHQNKRCSSGRIYVVKLYWNNGREHKGTAYYCENEYSEFNFVCNSIPGTSPYWSIQTEIINQKSAEEIEAEQQAALELERQKVEQQREAARQREAERLEKQRKFEESKQELVADLKGMAQEITRPLELLGEVGKSTNSLELKGMGQKSDNTLELKGMNLSKEDDGVIAYIGNSRVPIYKNPSDLVVNTQQDIPQIPTLDHTTINNPIQKSQDDSHLQKWKDKCEQTDTETLQLQLLYYNSFEDMATLSWNSYPGKQGESSSALQLSGYSKEKSWSKDWGFDCTLYKKTDEKGNESYVLAFTGTDSFEDALGSWVQGAVTPTMTQSRIALSLMDSLKRAGFPMNKLTVTGHSLGGRLAAEVAIEHDITAYTFNAAGVSVETKERLEKEHKWNNSGSIVNIQAGNDELTNIQEGLSYTFGGKTPYVNNSFVKDLTNTAQKAIDALPSTPLTKATQAGLFAIGQDVTTVGGQLKIAESSGGHDMNSLHNDIVNRKKVIQEVINNRNTIGKQQ